MLGDILKDVQVCVPYKLLKEKYLPVVLEKRLNPEIGIDGEALDSDSYKDFLQVASLLRSKGLAITLHAPFHDLAPGAVDKKILETTRQRLSQAWDLIPLFEPLSVVVHTGYDRKRYEERDAWLATALETWTPLVKALEGTKTALAFENVYEKTPIMLKRLLTGLHTEGAGFCFDVGHMNVFSSTDMETWLKELGPFLKQLHLHDNMGDRDDHLALGAGEIPFDALFQAMKKRDLKPILTLEAHKEEWIWKSLEFLSRSESFRRMVSGR
jgi:sugar phosphate isomerase/epimerase